MQSKFFQSLHVAVSLLRVRRLFFSLFLGPVLLGLIIVLVQTAATVILIDLSNEDSEQFGERMSSSTESEILRGYVFGSGEIPDQPRICNEIDAANECPLKESDIVVHNQSNRVIDIKEFQETFRGAAQRIHFCKDCTSDFILTVGESNTETRIFSLSGLAVLFLADNRRLVELRHHLTEAKSEKERAEKVQGNIKFHPPGLESPLAFELLCLILKKSPLFLS